MKCILTEAQVDRWRLLREEMKADGFFSFEALSREAESMMRWASEPLAIAKLAENVDEVID